MSISITEDIKTVSDLKKKTGDIFKQLHRTGRPIIVTVNGKPDAVLINVEVFEKKLKALNLSALIAEAETDVKERRTRPVREFLKELKRSAKA
ncbi:MAG: type II toxin-antitoxin system Phd/YefM family antitoxin [Thermodesulfovibrionales bacterium]|nr:type II toxin-antitoxin system Phd/YefM family antitoxin [Thermodesulfovibrionales bacterium]MDP3112667.1 type II toxin-antitoxin system Phd/YefM family antitoxin [Thermodesulfovibrionales bacterium]